MSVGGGGGGTTVSVRGIVSAGGADGAVSVTGSLHSPVPGFGKAAFKAL